MVMALAGAAQLAVKGLSSLSLPNKKDPDRFAANQAAYTKAIRGDAAALEFLHYRTGKYGVGNVTGYGEVGGWATDAAKADAQAKYDAAVAQLPAPAAPTPSPLSQELGSLADNVRHDVAASFGRIGAGATNAATRAIDPQNAGVNVPVSRTGLVVIAAIVVAVVAGVYFLARRH